MIVPSRRFQCRETTGSTKLFVMTCRRVCRKELRGNKRSEFALILQIASPILPPPGGWQEDLVTKWKLSGALLHGPRLRCRIWVLHSRAVALTCE